MGDRHPAFAGKLSIKTRSEEPAEVFDNGASPGTRPSRGPSRISADRRVVSPSFASPFHPNGRDMHSQPALAHRRLRGTPRHGAETSPPSELGGLAGGGRGEAPRPARSPASCRPERRARDVPTGRPASRPRSASVPPHPTLPNRVPPFSRASPPSPALLPPRALPSPAVRRPAHRAARPVPSSAPGLSARRRHRRVARPGDRIGNGYRFLPTHGARGRDARVRQGRCTASVVARGAGRPRE